MNTNRAGNGGGFGFEEIIKVCLLIYAPLVAALPFFYLRPYGGTADKGASFKDTPVLLRAQHV